MNKVILMGRLTRDPELRYSKSSTPVAVTRYSLAVNRQFKREGQPDADFINIVAFGNAGEFSSKYFKKGQMVSVVGRLQISTVDDGNGNKRYFTDVIAEEQHFAESKASFEAHSGAVARPNNQPNNFSAPAKEQKPAEGFFPIDDNMDDDLPF